MSRVWPPGRHPSWPCCGCAPADSATAAGGGGGGSSTVEPPTPGRGWTVIRKKRGFGCRSRATPAVGCRRVHRGHQAALASIADLWQPFYPQLLLWESKPYVAAKGARNDRSRPLPAKQHQNAPTKSAESRVLKLPRHTTPRRLQTTHPRAHLVPGWCQRLHGKKGRNKKRFLSARSPPTPTHAPLPAHPPGARMVPETA